ncbi:benenodin family lasso peptide [Sphingobium yanoikuyae]|uniref:Benenodin family lasso peptide n=1 Tax=Sphingobium yanoikuyae TaxID=13690 RepID=A0A430BQC7_SPHYA|nr:benenodin family lasso peptide [Sphingobium yanoikuyae]RSU54922.1 benenodin family lasso peptide [Sphingobium yanoikuyae]
MKTMDKHEDAVVDLGAASVKTQGVIGRGIDSLGLQEYATGIADD